MRAYTPEQHHGSRPHESRRSSIAKAAEHSSKSRRDGFLVAGEKNSEDPVTSACQGAATSAGYAAMVEAFKRSCFTLSA